MRNPGIRTLGIQGQWDGSGDDTARAWGLQKAKGTHYLTVLLKTTASSKLVISVGQLEDGSRTQWEGRPAEPFMDLCLAFVKEN